MILQRIGNRGLFLGTLFDDAVRDNSYQAVTLDHELDVAPELGRRLDVYTCALLVADLATALADANVRPGDRVAVHKADGFDIFLLACAVSRVGAVPMVLSPSLPGDVVGRLLDRAGWPTLISDEATLTGRLPAQVRDKTERILVVGNEVPGTSGLRADRGEVPTPPVRYSPDSPALITHTSGTTDVPKLVVHTARTLRARYRPQALAIRMLVRQRETLALHVSFVHSRLVTALAIALRRGFPLVIVRDSAPARVADLFAEHRPGILEAHPNTLVRWEELADDPRGVLRNVKYVSSTFDAIHPRTVRILLGSSKRARPAQLQLYGQSEVGPTVGRVTSRRRSESTDGRCVGFAFPGMTGIRVVPRDGNPPSATTPGYIEVRSDGRALTYLDEDRRFRRQLDDGWWRMGDVGYRTRWGCLHICDREVDVIPGFGSVLEIEDTLMSRLVSVREIVVVPNADGVPTPVVVTKDGAPLEHADWAAATSGLPAMHPPLLIDLADLPTTGTSKVRRLELVKQLDRLPTTPAVRAEDAART